MEIVFRQHQLQRVGDAAGYAGSGYLAAFQVRYALEPRIRHQRMRQAVQYAGQDYGR